VADMVETYAGPVAWWEGISPTVRERTILNEDVGLDEMFTLAGLDWTVSKQPLMVAGKFPQKVQQAVAIQRNTDGAVLGVVGPDYVTIQNDAMKAIAKDILDNADVKCHTAGSLFGGATVWVLLKVNGEQYVRGDGSPFSDYLLLRTGHNGRTSLGAFPTMVRVVCWNTETAAIMGASHRYTIKHTVNAEYRVGEARKALDIHFKFTETMREFLDSLTYKDFSPIAAVQFTETLLPIDPKSDNPYKTIAQRDSILALFDRSETLVGVAPTAYRMYQAVAEYADHVAPVFATRRGSAGDRRVSSIVDGQAFDLKSRAAALLAKA